MINESLILDVQSKFQKYGGEPLQFRKVLATVGTFSKDKKGDVVITQEMIDHWPKEFERWREKGHTVTLPLSHKEADNVEANRGYVTQMFAKGKDLVGIIEFADEEAAKLANRAETSIYSPPALERGGEMFVRPITHVALTNDPVLPNLGGFQEIAASFDLRKEKKMTKSLKDLALKLGLAVEDQNDDQLFDLLLEKLPAEQPEQEEEEKFDVEKAAEEVAEQAETVAASHKDKVLKDLLRENRKLQIERVVAEGKITPVVAKQLTSTYLGDDSLTLALSHGNAEFDSMMAVLNANDPILSFKEESGPQSLSLPDSRKGAPSKNILLDLAKKRAEAQRR